MQAFLYKLIPLHDPTETTSTAPMTVLGGPSRTQAGVHLIFAGWFGAVMGAGGCGALVLPIFFPFAFAYAAFLGLIGGLPVAAVLAALTLTNHYPMVDPDRFRRMVQWIAWSIVAVVIGTGAITALGNIIHDHQSAPTFAFVTLWAAWCMISNQLYGRWIANRVADSYLKRWTFAPEPQPMMSHGIIHADGGWYE